jgi:hypothetical protein
MSYADSLLSTGERITHRVRQHWFVLLWGARIPIAAILAALLLVVLSQNVTDGNFRTVLGWLTAILFVGGMAFLTWGTLRYLNTEFVLTNRRVVQVEGVVNKRATDSSLEKINDAVLTQSIFGRMFGFGDLDVLTAAEAGIERFRMIIDPIGFKRAMLDAKHEYEVDMERSGWQPSPPIRAATPGGGPAGTSGSGAAARPGTDGDGPVTARASSPAPAEPVLAAAPLPSAEPAVQPPDESGERITPERPVATGPATEQLPPAPSATEAPPPTPPAASPRFDPVEVTLTLANLADLRDRGAISAEEYETKKTDLLGRL